MQRDSCYSVIYIHRDDNIAHCLSWLWEVWCERKRRKYEGKRGAPKYIYYKIIHSVRCTTFPACHSSGDLSILSSLRHASFVPALTKRVKPIVVRWSLPPVGGFKLNVDGASKGNPGHEGGGRLIRDHKGSIILAFSHFYGQCFSLVAEARAMLDGLRYASCYGIGLHSVKSDSETLVKIIKEDYSCPWRLLPFIKDLRSLIRNLNSAVVHIYREGNQAVDGLANLACQRNSDFLFYDIFRLLPPSIRGVCRMDRLGIPYIRV